MVATFCTTTQAENKAGAGASTAGKGNAEEYIKQAEGTICALTRRKFVSNYDNLTDNAKLILEEAASNLAAIYIITYDMSGYNTRIEAEDIINILRDTALRNISILSDSKTITYLENGT